MKGVEAKQLGLIIGLIAGLLILVVIISIVTSGKIGLSAITQVGCSVCNVMIGNWISSIPLVGEWINPCTKLFHCTEVIG